jgi:hypothetical protein
MDWLLRTRRESKAGFCFLELSDGSCMKNLQIVAEATLPNYLTEIQRLTTGCSIEAQGKNTLSDLDAVMREAGWPSLPYTQSRRGAYSALRSSGAHGLTPAGSSPRMLLEPAPALSRPNYRFSRPQAAG